MQDWNIQVELREPLKAVYAHVLSDTPEDDASKIIVNWAKKNGIYSKEKATRTFGRNTFPTDKQEPHGYQLFITVNEPVKLENGITRSEIPGGLYAVLRSTTIPQMSESWPALWKWIENSEYEHTGWVKGEHGWVGGFEENRSLFSNLHPKEWRFDLMIPVKKKK